MNWKFWKIDDKNHRGLKQRSSKLSKPKDLPNRVGIYLVRELKLDPDWVWTLKGVVRPMAEKHNFEIRIFDPKDAVVRDAIVTDFNALNAFPEMILFEGCFNKDSGWVDIKRTADKAA
ncbi:MAG: hypothetical protein PVJ54_02150 [Desulfobacterales bacterium]|jgi:hypothetical protein